MMGSVGLQTAEKVSYQFVQTGANRLKFTTGFYMCMHACIYVIVKSDLSPGNYMDKSLQIFGEHFQ